MGKRVITNRYTQVDAFGVCDISSNDTQGYLMLSDIVGRLNSADRCLRNTDAELAQLRAQVKAQAAEIERRRSKHDWISVKDRLPENKQEVFAWDGYAEGLDFYWFENDRFEEIDNRGESGLTSDHTRWITHWMPLPVPPEGPADGEEESDV